MLPDAKDKKDKAVVEVGGEKERASPASADLKKQADGQAAAQELISEEQWDANALLRRLTRNRDNPRERKYQEVIRALEEWDKFERFGDQYAQRWQDLLEERTAVDKDKIKVLREKIQGKIVVDLGGGLTSEGQGWAPSVMQGVAEKSGAKIYVNVDRFFPGHEHEQSEPPLDITEDLELEQPPEMKIIYAPGDILGFLQQMPSQSPEVVLVVNGIDGFVIPRRIPGLYSSNYHQMVAEEIARVLPKGGVVLTCGSEDITEHFKYADFDAAPGYSSERGAMFGGQVWVRK